MSNRLFDNPNNVSETILNLRLQKQDASGWVHNYDVDIRDDLSGAFIKTAHYSVVNSILSDAMINTGIAQALTLAEQSTLTRLQNAQGQAALATALKTVTPDQAVAYIEANVTSLATAKAVMEIMARILIALRDEVWPDLPNN